ncbi:MAG: hypothetical protein AAGH53_10875 [Pseudomonadota bacterium]
MRFLGKFLIAASVLLSPLAAPVSAQDAMPWLSSLKLGMWEIRDRANGEKVDRVCVRDRKQLLQLRHRGPLCKREVLREKGDEGYIYYQCGNKGHGYTSLKMENSGLAQINSQGLFNNAPFQFSVEARHVGSCR